ncbi:MAG: YicC family protein, partial [Clostridia bacterium]|nr:YicC family protein [Clostridia bacterium]
MIRSMTGYGRSRQTVDGVTVTVELKSVNSRYLEFSPRVYKNYAFVEDKLKAYIQGAISRGKVDCFVQIENGNETPVTVSLNKTLADGYFSVLSQMQEQYGLSEEISVTRIAAFPDVLSVRKEDEDEDLITRAVLTVLKDACASFIRMREIEGEKLAEDILSRCDHIIALVETVEKRSPETVREYYEKLSSRMREILEGAQVDEQRLLTEAAVFADKIAVDEETVRLRSHIAQMRKLLGESDEPVGRKLDFIVQEINRESNTIGSKAQNIDIARTVIELKAEVEKIR